MVVHRGGAIKKGRLINVTGCRVAGSDVSVARAANLLQATSSPCRPSIFQKLNNELLQTARGLQVDLQYTNHNVRRNIRPL